MNAARSDVLYLSILERIRVLRSSPVTPVIWTGTPHPTEYFSASRINKIYSERRRKGRRGGTWLGQDGAEVKRKKGILVRGVEPRSRR